jgi:nucleoid-associated protein YgaU
VVVLGAALLSPFAAHAAAAAGDRPMGARTYVVRTGDTLWSIAARFAGPGTDPRPFVDELQQANRLSGVIVPGETLRLP